mgnify:CR=1 FL=1
MEFLEAATWITISKIILIDILLAGDNAVVIGMAAGKLAPELQKKAVIWGGLCRGAKIVIANRPERKAETEYVKSVLRAFQDI